MLYIAAREGWVTIYSGFAEAGPVYLVLSLALMFVAHDAYFYWTHRLMHHRRLFGLFHRWHHLSRTPTVWTAYSFSVPEAIVQGAFVPLFVALVPMHALALFIFVAVQVVRNVMGHAGYELHPAAFAPGRWLGWNNTTTGHDLHHELGRYNYGFYFRWWDKLMGTEHPGYPGKVRSHRRRQGRSGGPAMSSLRAVFLPLMLLAALRPAHAADEVFGRSATPGVSAVVELAPCSDGVTLCGTIRWLWDALDERGRPRLDAQNADTGLRTRPMVGLTILSGLKADPAGGWQGRIYNPEDGQTYRATVKRRGADPLLVEGCVLIVCSKQCGARRARLRRRLGGPSGQLVPASTGNPAARHSGKPSSSRRTLKPRAAQLRHCLVGQDAVGTAAVGHDLLARDRARQAAAPARPSGTLMAPGRWPRANSSSGRTSSTVTTPSSSRSHQLAGARQARGRRDCRSSCAPRARPRPIVFGDAPQRREEIQHGIVGQPIEDELAVTPRRDQPGAPHVLQVLRGVGDRQLGRSASTSTLRSPCASCSRSSRRWGCAAAFATAANWANRTRLGLSLDIRTASLIIQ